MEQSQLYFVNTADYFPITDDIARPQTVDYNCP